MPPLALLFKRFLKLGATAYGGPAMMGQIKKAVVNEWRWIREEELLRGIVLCQLIPGATMVQIVAYIGYRLRGIWGALVSGAAFILPAFFFLLILSSLYTKFQTLWIVQALFKGLSAIVVAIILSAGITLSKSIIKDWRIALISILSFFAFLFRLNILLIFILAALAALLLNVKGSQARPAPDSLEQKDLIGKNHLFLGFLAVIILISLLLSYLIDPRVTSLFLIFSKVGALAFGGGFTIIPLIQYEVVDRFQWLTTKEFLDGIALGQVTPGPIMITATFIGYKLSGFWGALMTTVGIFYPSFFILILLIPYYDRLKGVEKVRSMEQGILGSFIGMLGLVLYNFGRTALVDIPSIVMAGAAFFALIKKIGLPYILIFGGILSIFLFGLFI